jgi:hypothetical protein
VGVAVRDDLFISNAGRMENILLETKAPSEYSGTMKIILPDQNWKYSELEDRLEE